MIDRVAVFIDGNYLNRVLEQAFDRMRIDYRALAMRMAGDTQMLRTYYYNCLPYASNNPTEEEARKVRASQQFFSALQALPRFDVRLGKLAFRGVDYDNRPIYIQKRVDVLLSVDVLRLVFNKYVTRIVLLAGDSDFIPVIEVAKQQGVITTLWHGVMSGPNGTVHQDLWNVCDERFELTREILDTMRLSSHEKESEDVSSIV